MVEYLGSACGSAPHGMALLTSHMCPDMSQSQTAGVCVKHSVFIPHRMIVARLGKLRRCVRGWSVTESGLPEVEVFESFTTLEGAVLLSATTEGAELTAPIPVRQISDLADRGGRQ